MHRGQINRFTPGFSGGLLRHLVAQGVRRSLVYARPTASRWTLAAIQCRVALNHPGRPYCRLEELVEAVQPGARRVGPAGPSMP